MVQLGPDTTSDASSGSPSATAAGYSSGDTLLRGFSATHLSGAGCPVFGDVPLLPVVGPLPADPAAATVAFGHEDEQVAPGSYRVQLGNGVSVALVAGTRTGLAQFTFPRSPQARLLVKASGSLAGAEWARVRHLSPREVSVAVDSGAFCRSDSGYRVHVLLRFDRPVTARGTWGGRTTDDGRAAAGPGVGGWVSFDTREDPVVRVRLGVSFVDAAGARRNLAAEDRGWVTQRYRSAAERAWSRELGRIDVAGGAPQDRRRLATALYHVLLHPTLLSDADGRYPGFDGRVHQVAPGRRHYTAIPGWDSYRTHLPLLAWLRPDVASDVVRSLQRSAREGGWLPRWPLVASYTGVMNGDSAAPVIAAAHAFGARDFNLPHVLARLVHNAEVTDGAPGQGWFQPRPGLADYLSRGYVPNTAPEPGWSQPHGASTTLEYALDDFAVSRLAGAAGRPGLTERFRARSGSWRTLLDDTRALLLPRDAAGVFPGDGYDPASCCNGFQEGNAVQYSWAVPQDMAGLLSALGTREQVLDRLVAFHSELNAGAGRPFAWMGNQPSLATPWASLWLRRPSHAADVVARVRRELWTGGPGGLPGNDDLGGLSAWYVWTALGLYPLTPGTATVWVTPPVFASALVRPSVGSATRIDLRGDGSHVRGLWLDGVSRSASWWSLAPGRRPSRVVVATTDSAAPAWGTDPRDVPPSYPAGWSTGQR